MKILAEISDKDVGFKDYNYFNRHFLVRKAVRGVLLDDNDKVYLMHLAKRGIYKIPGGGVEEGEDIQEALKREVWEEAGVDFEILKELGLVIERRYYEKDPTGLFQITYSYLLRLKGELSDTHFTKEEENEGALSLWVGKKEVINKIKGYDLVDYEAHFIKVRELRILEEASKYW